MMVRCSHYEVAIKKIRREEEEKGGESTNRVSLYMSQKDPQIAGKHRASRYRMTLECNTTTFLT